MIFVCSMRKIQTKDIHTLFGEGGKNFFCIGCWTYSSDDLRLIKRKFFHGDNASSKLASSQKIKLSFDFKAVKGIKVTSSTEGMARKYSCNRFPGSFSSL